MVISTIAGGRLVSAAGVAASRAVRSDPVKVLECRLNLGLVVVENKIAVFGDAAGGDVVPTVWS